MMHPTHLPFTEAQLKSHFADVKQGGRCAPTSEKHIEYYRRSLKNYEECPQGEARRGKSLKYTGRPCQVEKDERFWTTACLMTIFYSENRQQELTKLFQKAYGNRPPLAENRSWEDLLKGKLHLFFETNLPAPQAYKDWLRMHLSERQMIPFIRDSDNGTKNLEGPTNVDAILLNEENGFSVIIEAKVLSDISYQITYDVMRNQIARNIDVMLEDSDSLCPPLDKRDPDKTLFLLLTPRAFQNNPSSRLYGYRLNEYRDDPSSLRGDLPHRTGDKLEGTSKRLGWLTWENFQEVNPNCCKWLG